jgi:hypothetical protein
MIIHTRTVRVTLQFALICRSSILRRSASDAQLNSLLAVHAQSSTELVMTLTIAVHSVLDRKRAQTLAAVYPASVKQNVAFHCKRSLPTMKKLSICMLAPASVPRRQPPLNALHGHDYPLLPTSSASPKAAYLRRNPKAIVSQSTSEHGDLSLHLRDAISAR